MCVPQSKYEEKWGSLMVPKLTEEEHACAADEAAIRDLIFIDLQASSLLGQRHLLQQHAPAAHCVLA